MTTARSYSGLSYDDGAYVISKLGALQTKTYQFTITPFLEGKVTLDIHLDPKVTPYDDKSKIKTVIKTPTSVKKSQKFKTTITYKVNKKPVKGVKV